MNPGQWIADRYLVDRVVGEGGMGSVYQAHDRSGRKVAIKTLRRTGVLSGGSATAEGAGGAGGFRAGETGRDRLQKARFRREIDALQRVQHEAVVRHLDHGTTDDGMPYLVLEWLDGHDLAERLSEGPLSVEATKKLASKLFGALAEAHRAGVIHRDVKPGNVFLVAGESGRPKLLDFGLARTFDRSTDPATRSPATNSTATEAGSLVGTPAYLAPEQARGEVLDGRSDLFALGCLLFECLTGRRAFRGDNPMAVLAKILLETPPDVSSLQPEVPEWLSTLVSALLAKDPARRPQSAERALEAIRLRDAMSALPESDLTVAEGPKPGPPDVARPARPQNQPSTLTGDERRLVSVVLVSGLLISGDRGSGEQDSGQPRRRHDSINGELEDMGWRLAEHGGQMQVLATGDAVLVMAGAGVATDRVHLAARSALALARARPGIEISVATGRGRFDGPFPVGEVIDRAGEGLQRCRSASKQAEQDGSGSATRVAVDDLTTGLLDGRFEVEGGDHGLFLTGESRGAGSARRLLGRTTPFLGRERETRLLDALLASAAAGEGAQVAVITGPPGAGKSRLAAEQMDRWRNEGRDVWCGQADAMHSGAAWSLLAAMVGDAVGARDGEDDEIRVRKLRARLGRHLRQGDVDRLAPFLAEVAGVRVHDGDDDMIRARHDRELMADRIRSAWIDWLAAETRVAPLVLVLEDLQWADLPTLRAFDSALRELAERPLLIAAFARPQIAERFPNLWHERRPTRIELQRLPSSAGRRLVREMLDDRTPEAEVERLVAASHGNPFFLEELIRGHAEGRTEAPDTLLATVQVRLEELEDEHRRLLRAASIYGHSFWRGGVERLLGGEVGPGRFQRLEELELVERRPHSSYPDTVEFAFLHDLVREAAYASLTQDDLALGHRLAGEWLEPLEPSATVLLEHFRRADARDHVAAWLPRAAEEAFEAHDFDATIRMADEALEQAQGDLAGVLHLLCAASQRWRGDWNETQRRAEAAGDLLPAGSAEWFRAGAEVLTAAARRGDLEVAQRWQTRVAATEALAPGVGSDGTEEIWYAGSARITALALASRQTFHSGDYDEAERLATIAESIADRAQRLPAELPSGRLDPGAWADLHRLRGARARHRGDLAGDLDGYRQALEACEILGDVRQAANVRVSLGFGYLEVGDQETAESYLARGLREARRMGLESVVTRARQNHGLARVQRGDARGAVELLNRVVEEAEQQGNLRFVGWTSIYLSMAHLLGKDAAAAEQAARRAARLLADSPPARAGADAMLARALIAQDRAREAQAPAASALDVLRAQGGIEEFESLVWLAWLEVLQELRDEALIAAARRASEKLGERADALGDPKLRASFLSGVPENRRLVQLFETLNLHART